MPEEAAHEHSSSKGLFEGTIFEGGLSGKEKHEEHEEHASEFERLKHETKIGYFIFEWMAEWGVSRALCLWIVFLGLLLILGYEIPNFVGFTLAWLAGTAPVWVLVSLLISDYYVWIWYAQGLYISGRDPVLLEIKVPREISKSPRAMELVLVSLYNTSSETTFLHRIWRGQMRCWYSFEYASFGGEVHMYVWVWKTYQRVVEAAFYAQYPEIEIRPVEDYAMKFRYDPSKHSAFVNEERYTETDALPIRTYIDFELDKDPKEEYRVEPLAQMFEYLSSLKKGEQVWAQIIFRASGKYGSELNPKRGDREWAERVRKEVEKIRKKSSLNSEGKEGFPRPTWMQTEQIRAMERQLNKIPFDVAIRALYIADTTQTPYGGAGYGNMRWLFKAVNGENKFFNQIKPTGWHNTLDYPWQDFLGIRDRLMTRRFIDGYRRRDAFFAPWYLEYRVMTNEVIATLFHPPSSSVKAPGLERIPATKSEPPPNLPK
ncbi:MAG TPA: hypothetical protein VMU27_00965 [Candidatus Paceibacterota bacterium]|nr:hypothetical protein [Candidatus Paceibacterota bacterium]